MLVHQGGFQNGSTCRRTRSTRATSTAASATCGTATAARARSARIVAQLDDEVDLVISGHTHAAYNCSADTVDVIGIAGTAGRRPSNAASHGPAEQSRAPDSGHELELVRPRAHRHRPHDRQAAQRDATSSPCASTTSSSIAPTPTQRPASAANPECCNLVNGYNTAVSPLANAVIGTIVDQVNNTQRRRRNAAGRRADRRRAACSNAAGRRSAAPSWRS